MATRRVVEIFSAGCGVCEEAVSMVQRLACPSCDIRVLDMGDASIASRARDLGIKTVPAVVVDGELASCCRGAGPTEETLRQAGIGQPL
ncbi:MAG: thioredoxin family protein [Deltaproteobacteria bacterium]|nr:thioredoxin family protein [Deltaproteobacteria bacterium]MBW2668265.1 thioredoxin family protein [Deltaproteobacteria bacterium]